MPPVKAEHGQVYNKVFSDASENSYNAQTAGELQKIFGTYFTK